MGKPGKSRKRRVKGSGALFWSAAKKRWVGRVEVGRNPRTGKIVYAQRSAPTVETLQAKLKAVEKPGPITTVAEWCVRWLESRRVRANSTRIAKYSVEKRINPVLGSVRVRDLNPLHVEAACGIWGEQLAVSTVRQTAAQLSAAMGAARRAGLRPDNPVSLARLPKLEKSKVEIYTAAELARIVRAAAKCPQVRGVALVAAIGCRRGEVVALDCGDFDGQSVSITKTLHPDGSVGPPKTSTGVRDVPVPDLAIPALRAAKGGRAEGPLFLGLDGRRLKGEGLAHGWRKLAKEMGLSYRSLHKLRHSCGSALHAQGVPLANIARALGHTLAEAVRTYIHASPDLDMRRELNRMLGGGR